MMATAKRADPYRKLLRILLVLLVVFVALVTAYFWLDRYQKANFDVRQKEIAEKNEQMMAEYKQTLAEQLKNISTTGETVSRPEPKAQGVDVVDLSSFPLAGGQDVVVTRGEALTGGLLLLNRWHALPADFVMVEGELKSIMAETNFRVPTKDNKVLLFPEAIKALDAFVAAAKADGVEYYNIYEGFRTMDEQTRMWRDEEAKHTARYSGDALIEKVIFADDRETLEAATRALDRVLLHHHYIMPTYALRKSRIARWDRFSHPEVLPEFSVGFPTIWWWDDEKAAKVDAAQ